MVLLSLANILDNKPLGQVVVQLSVKKIINVICFGLTLPLNNASSIFNYLTSFLAISHFLK